MSLVSFYHCNGIKQETSTLASTDNNSKWSTPAVATMTTVHVAKSAAQFNKELTMNKGNS